MLFLQNLLVILKTGLNNHALFRYDFVRFEPER